MKLAGFLADLLDRKFKLFGVRFGLDPIFDLIPFIGGIIPTLLSFYFVYLAFRIHVPENKINQMIGNILFDFILGLIPFIGVVGDVLYKANSKNLAILKAYYVPYTEGEIIMPPTLTPSI